MKIKKIILSYALCGHIRIPKFILRLNHYPPHLLYVLGLEPIIGRIVLLLTTTGRKSGRPRVTPLQYEEIDGIIYLNLAAPRLVCKTSPIWASGLPASARSKLLARLIF